MIGGYKKGGELKIDDLMDVWWNSHPSIPNCDRITELRPYKGPLEYLFPEGAQIASFLFFPTGMTIDNKSLYFVYNK